MMKISLQTVNQGGKRVTMGRTNERLRLTKKKDRVAIFVPYRGLSTPTHCLKDGHQHPLIAVKTSIYNYSLPYREQSTLRPFIVLQLAIEDHS